MPSFQPSAPVSTRAPLPDRRALTGDEAWVRARCIDQRLARRGFLLAAAALLAGCATPRDAAQLPGGDFPGGRYDDLPPPRPVPAPPPPQVAVRPAPAPAKTKWNGGLVPRSAWTSAGPVPGREIKPMVPVKSITIHHEGWQLFTATDFEETAARIERVRIGHLNAKDGGYSDIGYHFIIDREGRVWEGRSLRYQGAHVRHRNEGNVGIMCLGNFEEQSPTSKQLAALTAQVKAMRSRYKVPVRKVYTHQEWPNAQTLCPGASLQAWVVKNRSSAFA